MDKVAREYKRLNYSDRKAIEAMCKEGKRVTEIAEAMDVHRATVYATTDGFVISGAADIAEFIENKRTEKKKASGRGRWLLRNMY